MTALSKVTRRRELAPGLVTIRFHNPKIARETIAGHFVNVLPRAGANDPMLRRPFSVYNTDGDEAEIIVQAHGRGTNLIASIAEGELLDVLGPLGNPWNYKSGDFNTAVLVVGGVGVASMLLLTRALLREELPVQTYYGARTKDLLALQDLKNLHLATDDGSQGFHGSVIEMLRNDLKAGLIDRPKLFVCGPTGMMRAAAQLGCEFDIPCELSLETEMACGIGICQGCPVLTDEDTFNKTGKRFRLVCVDGPSFSAEAITI
ncbi:MAG: dihydroorotate dehydrogenase electron transfer subunit [Bacteroidota bacterium]|nr:dihydroorotate dehydrogenase electron transfer subunit [Bacteroidota bacterium]MDP4234802.1 dihydroorotate dehydrogenase electron transfer subunit [Bacteroidota bacterium]MDP4289340.1 dihydroorotate dehydrogenase electron transfer subunit [Bacteroidota bacterium]